MSVQAIFYKKVEYDWEISTDIFQITVSREVFCVWVINETPNFSSPYGLFTDCEYISNLFNTIGIYLEVRKSEIEDSGVYNPIESFDFNRLYQDYDLSKDNKFIFLEIIFLPIVQLPLTP